MPTKLDPSTREAFAPFERQLIGLPFVERVLIAAPPKQAGRGVDLVVRLRLADRSERRLLVQQKSSHLASGSAHHLRAGLAETLEDSLVTAPYVGAPLGDALEAEGVQFIDLAGNCYLNLDGRFVARIQGRSPPKSPARAKALRSAGYQVLFALLAEPELVAATQRELAEAAGTSRQPVIDLFARLVEERILARRGRKHEWVRERDGALLDRWLAGYRSTLRPKLYVGRYRLPETTPEELEAALEAKIDHLRYGGTAAAHRLVGHYRGPDTVVYLGEPTRARQRALRATPARTEQPGDLVWMRAFGTASLEGASPDTVHPLLVYAELMSDPDPRAGESARLVRQEHLPWSL